MHLQSRLLWLTFFFGLHTIPSPLDSRQSWYDTQQPLGGLGHQRGFCKSQQAQTAMSSLPFSLQSKQKPVTLLLDTH